MKHVKLFNNFKSINEANRNVEDKNEIMEYFYDMQDDKFTVEVSSVSGKFEIMVYKSSLFSYSEIQKYLPRLKAIEEFFNVESFDFILQDDEGDMSGEYSLAEFPKEKANSKIISDISMTISRSRDRS